MRLASNSTKTLGLLCLCCCLTMPLQGLINSGNPAGNRSAPTGEDGQPHDPGFAYAGNVGPASGVYLGDGWVLTAKHNPAANLRLGRNTYKWDGVTNIPSDKADLRLFKLQTWPKLPPLTIADAAPEVGAEVVMIGSGYPGGPPETFWKIDRTTQPWTWTVVPTREAADAAGFLASRPYQTNWGTNRVTRSTGSAFITDFDEDPAKRTAYEAQAVSADSGGPVFMLRDGEWQLCGIISSISGLYSAQPKGTDKNARYTSALYGNKTIAIDLSAHREFILSHTQQQ